MRVTFAKTIINYCDSDIVREISDTFRISVMDLFSIVFLWTRSRKASAAWPGSGVLTRAERTGSSAEGG